MVYSLSSLHLVKASVAGIEALSTLNYMPASGATAIMPIERLTRFSTCTKTHTSESTVSGVGASEGGGGRVELMGVGCSLRVVQPRRKANIFV